MPMWTLRITDPSTYPHEREQLAEDLPDPSYLYIAHSPSSRDARNISQVPGDSQISAINKELQLTLSSSYSEQE